MRVLNLISFYSLLLLPLAFIFSVALVNIIIVIIVFNFLLSSLVYKDYSLIKNNLFYFLVIFWVYISIQSFFFENANSIKSISYIRFLLLPFSIAYLLNQNLKKIIQLKIFYLLTVLFVGGDVLLQFLTGKDLFGYRADHINGIFEYPFERWKEHTLQRFAGPFGFDKKAGAFILFFGILGFFLNNNLVHKKIDLHLILFFLIMTGSIIITGDRAPLIILFITFLMVIIFQQKFRKKAIVVFISSALVFSSILIFSEDTKYRYISNIIEYSQSENSNQNLNQKIAKMARDNPWTAHFLTATEIFKDSPIFGKGVRSFRYECKKYPDVKTSYAYLRCSTHPHNLFFEIISEIGSIGLIMFLLIIFELLRTKKKSYSNNLILYLFFATIIPIKPTGAIFSTWFGAILWLLIGFYFWEINKCVKKIK